jgi:hypothetical protein
MERNFNDLSIRLRSGEKVTCHICGKGIFQHGCKDSSLISICHGFACDNCGLMVNIDDASTADLVEF